MAAPSYSARVIADGATNYWRLDEASGLALDSIGGKHGTVSGGVTRDQPGLVADGRAVQFDGVATSKIQSALAVTLPAACTFEAWVQTTWPDYRPIFTLRPEANFQIATKNAPTNGVVQVWNGGFAFGSKLIADGARHHVVVVFTGTDCLVSVDGALDTTTPLVHSLRSGPARLGHDQADAISWLGAMDEVALYATALTPAQILAHYQLGIGTFDSPYSKGSPALPIADRLLLQGAVAAGTVSPAVNLAGCSAYTVNVISNGAVTGGGMVQIEEAHDPDYTGTWAVRAGIPVVPGLTVLRAVETAKAVRARITTAITGGSVSVLLVAAGD